MAWLDSGLFFFFAYWDLELKIHNCHSVNTSFIIITEEVLKSFFWLHKGEEVMQIPIERLINLEEKKEEKKIKSESNQVTD